VIIPSPVAYAEGARREMGCCATGNAYGLVQAECAHPARFRDRVLDSRSEGTPRTKKPYQTGADGAALAIASTEKRSPEE
jgi:hypothetical protein